MGFRLKGFFFGVSCWVQLLGFLFLSLEISFEGFHWYFGGWFGKLGFWFAISKGSYWGLVLVYSIWCAVQSMYINTCIDICIHTFAHTYTKHTYRIIYAHKQTVINSLFVTRSIFTMISAIFIVA